MTPATPPPRHSFAQLLLRSITEADKVSPRLATVFAFVLATLALLFRGAAKRPEVVQGIIISSWPPEYIWIGLLGLIAGLLGLGKVADTLLSKTQIVADAQVATANITGETPAAPATATTTTQTTLRTDPQ